MKKMTSIFLALSLATATFTPCLKAKQGAILGVGCTVGAVFLSLLSGNFFLAAKRMRKPGNVQNFVRDFGFRPGIDHVKVAKLYSFLGSASLLGAISLSALLFFKKYSRND